MKRIFLVLSVLALALTTAVHTADDAHATAPDGRNIGVGLVLGSPTGFNLQIGFGESAAIDIVVGGTFFYGSSFYTHAQFLWNFELAEWEPGKLGLHVGGGLAIAHRFKKGYYGYYGYDFDDYYDANGKLKNYRTRLYIRIPVGVSFTFNKVPVDVFMEFAPSIRVFRKPGFEFAWSTGARYWF